MCDGSRGFAAAIAATLLPAMVMAGGCGKDLTGAGPGTIASPTEPAAVDLSGNYVLTLIASPSCNAVVDLQTHVVAPLPAVAQSRTYDASIVQSGNGVTITISEPGCLNGVSADGGCAPIPPSSDCHHYALPGGCVDGTVTGHQLAFLVPPAQNIARMVPECSGGDLWWEPFSATEAFEACGVASAAVDDAAHIAGVFNGTLGYNRFTPDRAAHVDELYCLAADHHFTLVKR